VLVGAFSDAINKTISEVDGVLEFYAEDFQVKNISK